MQAVEERSLYDFIVENKDKIQDVYVTSIHQYGFNDMEGWQYDVTVKLVTTNGYKNKLLKVTVNDTYFDGEEFDNKKELYDYISDWLGDWYQEALK